MQWHGENALVSASNGWRAIVSLDRGRLVHFGPDAADGPNLLFAPDTRDDPAGWGGHRVWLGPQARWPSIWPPPDAWEKSGPDFQTVTDGILRMLLPDAGDGWPRVTRTYQWDGARLVCGVELSGGTRPAQIIQIIQIPRDDWTEAQAHAEPGVPLGYVLLPAGEVHQLTKEFAAPQHVSRQGDTLRLKHIGVIQKLGFRPEALAGGRTDGRSVTVRRGPQSGQAVDAPDQGFFTQVYLGGNEPFIELEQLTSIWAPKIPARSTVIIEGAGN